MIFLDTNIIAYALTEDGRKAEIARRLIDGNAVLSVQVLNEFASVAKRRTTMSYADITQVTAALRATCRIEPLTEATHVKALALAERYHLHIYDANIWAAAIIAGCDMLCSEDMQHGLTIEGATLHNPFAA